MKPIQRIKLREERFVTPDNKVLMAKAKLKRGVIKLLTKLQAYNIYEKIKRNKHCVIPVGKFVKDFQYVPQNFHPNERANKNMDSLSETGESEDDYDDDLSLESEINSMVYSNLNGKIKHEDGGEDVDAKLKKD